MTAHVFRKIFAVTDPASNILQSEQIDCGKTSRDGRGAVTNVLAETKESVAGTNIAARFSSKTCHEKEEGK